MDNKQEFQEILNGGNEKLSIVPYVKKDAKTENETYKKQFLLDLCQKYNLEPIELRDIVRITGEYGTNAVTVLGIMSQGYDIESAEQFLLAREALEEDERIPSIESIISWHETFDYDQEPDGEKIANEVSEAHTKLGIARYYTETIKYVLDRYETFELQNRTLFGLEALLEYISSIHGERQQSFYRIRYNA